MKNPVLVIMHKLPNRIRLKLSHPLKRVIENENMMKEHEGIERVTYNEVTKSIVINFNGFKIDAEEVIIRAALVYSKDYGFVPVKLVSNYPKKEMPVLSYYSMLSIIAGAIGKYATPLGNIQDFLNWIAVGTTIGAIGEHAYSEINEKGTVDPEVMSVMYLINSVKKGNFIDASAITWIATFGRHILNTSYDKVVLKTSELKDSCTGEIYYNVAILPDKDSKDKIGLLKDFLSRFIEKEKSNIEKSILVTKSGVNNIDRRYCGFSNGCKGINVKYGLKGFV